MIILTEEQAELVRGQGAPGSRLEPLALADGVTWVLPEAVLTDPAYEAQHAALAALPTRMVEPEEYGGEA
ncbi:MAG: hypothetical protein Q8J89_02010 [Caulobacter sp.]|nr:hypothetical protein [Caulobacter sp.]